MFLVVIALGALSVLMAATAGAGGTQIDERCDIASANNPACVAGTTELNNAGNQVDANVGGTSQGQGQGLPFTGGDILLLTLFALAAAGVGGIMVMSRRRHAPVDAKVE